VNSKSIIDKYENDIKKFKSKIEALELSKPEAPIKKYKKAAAELSTEEAAL
jgi:hypothetical protein